jgi:hypothetical protein
MTALTLPGEELVECGLRDLKGGVNSIEAFLVSLASPRLRALGIDVPDPLPDAELRLYRLLAEAHGDGAHARYNGLLRRMVSYQRAVACAR